MGKIMDKGPWIVIGTGNDVALQSDDFKYDVRIEFDGDFGTGNLKEDYAHWLADRLNSPSLPSQET
jgi:hypothetical protein